MSERTPWAPRPQQGRSLARLLPAVDYSALKGATRALVRAVGTETQAAALTRVRQQEISNYGSAAPELGERFMPIDVVADLEAEVGPVVSRELARLTGHVLVPLPAIVATRNPLGRITARAMKETSEVFAKLGQALDDGVLTAAEGRQLDTEIDEAIEKLLALKAQVDVEAGGRE